jgi:hypothetical protein
LDKITAIYADLFLIIEFCCRVGSYTYNNASSIPGLQTYLTALKKFQDGDYGTQSELDGLLNTISAFLGGIL